MADVATVEDLVLGLASVSKVQDQGTDLLAFCSAADTAHHGVQPPESLAEGNLLHPLGETLPEASRQVERQLEDPPHVKGHVVEPHEPLGGVA